VTASTFSAVQTSQRAGKDDFQELARQVREAGLFYQAPWRAVARLGLIGALYLAGWTALFVVGNSWYTLLVAAYLAAVFGQVAFLGHDAGHRQSFRSRRANRAVGLVCGNLGIGISYSYWVTKHGQHHAHPNQIGADPDVGPGVICWTPEQATGKTGLGLAIAKHQAALFFPLTCLEAVNLHILSVRAVRSKEAAHRRTEAILLAAHGVVYLGALVLVLSPLRALAFLVVQQGAFGLYLGCAFAPNHKGMPMPSQGDELSFARSQVSTARNVRGGRALTVALGGLNYQIEHHLFPSMPMANLRRCRPLVKAYCLAHDMAYCESTLFGSYLLALRHLDQTSRLVRHVVPGSR
jgi:fatty acid desaturase